LGWLRHGFTFPPIGDGAVVLSAAHRAQADYGEFITLTYRRKALPVMPASNGRHTGVLFVEISMSTIHNFRSPGLRAGLFVGACTLALGTALAQGTAAPQSGAAEHVLAPGMAQMSFADLIEKVRPAVVSVKVKIENTAMTNEETDGLDIPNLPEGHPLEKFFKRFGDGAGAAPPNKQFNEGVGSGFIISADGYIVTNNHVVGHASMMTVTMDDGRTLDAAVVGKDAKTDLALLKVKNQGSYPYVNLAKTAPRVGDWVVAIGNPFGLGGTATAGIVSARGRDIGAGPYDDFLQIDAPVNKGNSGGPTFNTNGEVVGVNTAIFSPSGGSVGIAFGIPSDTVSTVVMALKDKGEFTRGFIGVHIQPITQEIADSLGLKDTKGALVAEVENDAPAADAGIHAGDIITAVNGDAIVSSRELPKKIGPMKPGDSAKVSILRDGKEQTVTLKLAPLPGEKTAKADLDNGKVAGTFGLQLAPAKDVDGAGKEGVVVAGVDPDGVGAEQGIRQGDVILEIAGKPVSEPAQVKVALDVARKDGRKAVLMRLKSGEDQRFVALAFPKKAS
jgi:serine protease Do